MSCSIFFFILEQAHFFLSAKNVIGLLYESESLMKKTTTSRDRNYIDACTNHDAFEYEQHN